MPMFDPDTGKVIDKDALRTVGFGTVALREAGTTNAAPKKVKSPGQKATRSTGYTP